MKLAKSLFLASVAALAAVSSASAADLGGIKKPAPAEYVRVCNSYGAGFFYIPGTQTCLKIGGRARFEYEYVTPVNANDGNTGGSGFRSIGRLVLDARTQSEYGPVRAFVRIDTQYRTGRYASGSSERYGLGFRTGGTVGAVGSGYAQKQTTVDLESAFVQFAGFTAGRLATFFDFGADQSFRGVGGSSQPGVYTVNQLAYTASFGSGFSATIAVEDPVFRQQGIGYVTYDAFGAPTSLGAQSAAGKSYYGGNKVMPDIVGVLRVDQGWGAAQLSGVVHGVNYGYSANGVNPDTDYGYAIQGGVKVNLPMIAPGDNIQAQATYGHGVVETVVAGYCGYSSLNICGNAVGKGGTFVGNLLALDSVYTGTPATGFRTKLTNSYGVMGYFTHYWTPTIRQNIGGAYAKVDYAGSTRIADFSLWTASSALIWSPIAGLDIGGEILYANIRGGSGFALSGATVLTKANGGGNEDQWQFRMRVQRDF